jgi:hypothetical protein
MTACSNSFPDDVAPAKRVVRKAAVPMQGAAFRSVRYVINGVTLVYQGIHEAAEPIPDDPEMELDGLHRELQIGDQRFESKILLGENALEQVVFGTGLTVDAAEHRCRETLHLQIAACDRIAGLNDAQRRKLQLAGRGDISRLFTRYRRFQTKFTDLAEEVDNLQAFKEWTSQLSSESKSLRQQWISATGSGGSLFVKTLATMTSPEQLAEFRRREDFSTRPSQPAVPVRLAAIQEQIQPAKPLEAILKEWEQATAKVYRLDCKFQSFKYDPTFEVEKRGTGSLAVDRRGRAVYRLTPVMIHPDERSRKKGKEGALYALQSDPHVSWHWTGRSRIHVDETARAFDETVFPVAPRAGEEFRPNPPALPQEDKPQSRNNAVAAKQPPSGPQAAPQGTISDRAEEIIVAALVAPIVWKLDRAIADGPRELPFARPFLLGMSAETLKERFKITVVKQADAEVWLNFIPLQRADALNFEKAVLILETPSYLPIALQLTDPTGSQTVHKFCDVKINLVNEGQAIPAGIEDLERPDLRGLRPAIEVITKPND